MKVVYLRGGEDRKARKSSDVKSRNFPFGSLRVPLIRIPDDGLGDIQIANSIPDKIALLRQHLEEPAGFVLLAPWPGKNVQDVFVVDNPETALAALERVLN